MDELPFLFRLFRAMVFKVGHTKWLGAEHFPFIATWHVDNHKIDLNEVAEAMQYLRPGDVILHRDDNFASNVAIGGAMVHAGIYVGQDQVIEAISSGVVKRHVGHILQSDRACILRPQFGDPMLACSRANLIVGFEYDFLFEFNGQEEENKLIIYGKDAAEMGVRFCCTEIPYFCYLYAIDKLRIYRRRNVTIGTKLLSLIGLSPGDKIIDADMYVTANFDLVWCSKLFTPEWAEKMGCSEEYVAKLRGRKS